MDKCEVCKKRPAVETRHIKEQQMAAKCKDIVIRILHTSWIPLCKECVIKGDIQSILYRGIQTNKSGLQLMRHENLSENKDKSSRKKYSPQQVKVVETYKDKLDVGWTQKKCILDLKHNHEIHISDTTFRKIITGNY